MSQVEIEKKIIEIVEELKKLNEILKNQKISELCDVLYCLSKSLYKLADKSYDAFDVIFFKGRDGVLVQLYSCSTLVHEVKVSEDITIRELFEKIFSDEQLRKRLLDEMQIYLYRIVREFVIDVDLPRRLEELEREIEDIKRMINRDP
jgi:hypothetical protein